MKFLSVCLRYLGIKPVVEPETKPTWKELCEDYVRISNRKQREIEELEQRIKELEFEAECTPVTTVDRWVMTGEYYSKFCKSFGPIVVNGNSGADEAAFKLGQQSVLARIGEEHVIR
jgi:hypothetical protein